MFALAFPSDTKITAYARFAGTVTSRSRIFATLFVLAVIPLSACIGQHSPTGPTGPDYISISSISPPDGTKLAAGSAATISATVSYQETCSDASLTRRYIAMYISDERGDALTPEIIKAIRGSQRSVSFSSQFAVPTTGVTEIHVTFVVMSSVSNCVRQNISTYARYRVSP